MIKLPSERTALLMVMSKIARYAMAQGEAQWTNGYRCAKDSAELYTKEMTQWRLTGEAERRTRQAVLAYGRAVRRAAKARE